MNTELLCRFLLAAAAVNYAILMLWFLAFRFARPWIRGMHQRWFDLSDSTFDAIHYAGMAAYKIGVLLFIVAPLVALHLMGGG